MPIIIQFLENILNNPKVGLIFLSPGTDETLRVGGHATLLRDEEMNARFAARGKPALLVMRVEIEECYFHCAKAFLRSALWHPSSWPDSMKVSFSAEINLRRAVEVSAMQDLDSQIAKRYETDL
ncbi:MAG: pyridoxamine 5'-phosphate oxidase family protein [Burkholderiales bacterium]